jgi:hypothetical protein
MSRRGQSSRHAHYPQEEPTTIFDNAMIFRRWLTSRADDNRLGARNTQSHRQLGTGHKQKKAPPAGRHGGARAHFLELLARASHGIRASSRDGRMAGLRAATNHRTGAVIQLTLCAPSKWDDQMVKQRGSIMPALFDCLYREYCRARLAEMRKQLLIRHPGRGTHEVGVREVGRRRDGRAAVPLPRALRAAHVPGQVEPPLRLISTRHPMT